MVVFNVTTASSPQSPGMVSTISDLMQVNTAGRKVTLVIHTGEEVTIKRYMSFLLTRDIDLSCVKYHISLPIPNTHVFHDQINNQICVVYLSNSIILLFNILNVLI